MTGLCVSQAELGWISCKLSDTLANKRAAQAVQLQLHRRWLPDSGESVLVGVPHSAVVVFVPTKVYEALQLQLGWSSHGPAGMGLDFWNAA